MKISFWEFISVAGGDKQWDGEKVKGSERVEKGEGQGRAKKKDNKRQAMRVESREFARDNKDNKKGLRLVSIMLFYDRCEVLALPFTSLHAPPPLQATACCVSNLGIL